MQITKMALLSMYLTNSTRLPVVVRQARVKTKNSVKLRKGTGTGHKDKSNKPAN